MSAQRDTARRRKLAEALASGMNKSAAARAAGYGRAQVYRLLEDSDFLRLLEHVKSSSSEPAGPDVSDQDREIALKTLREVAEDRDQPGTARVAAAKALLGPPQKAKQPAAAAAEAKPQEEPAVKAAPIDPREAARRWKVHG